MLTIITKQLKVSIDFYDVCLNLKVVQGLILNLMELGFILRKSQ